MLRTCFSKWWESRYNLSGPMKFGLGMTLLGLGLDFSLRSINPESVVRVYVVDRCLFVSYSGELCISPVGLSYVVN
jgi:POT family proton-dependent oligopeptide transporter